MVDAWIRVHANLADKPIVWRIVDALGVSKAEAVGLLVSLWGKLSQHGANGRVQQLADAQIEDWANWRGKRGRFAQFIREKHVDAEGRVNEWDEYNGTLETRREKDRERKRRIRGMSSGHSNGRPADSPADVPQDVVTTSAPTIRNDTIRNDKRYKRAPLAPTPDELRVLEHYRAVHPLRRTGDAEVKVVRKALALNYTADELCEAIDGNARDDWHVAKRKHELSYVLRNAEKIDTFRDAAVQVPLVDEATGALTAAGVAVMRGDR